jgi:acetyl esterase/lipase
VAAAQIHAVDQRGAGGAVTAIRHQGMTHDFVMLNALRGTRAAQEAITEAIDFLSKAIGTRA